MSSLLFLSAAAINNIEAVENSIRKRKTECGFFFNEKGDVMYSKRGNRNTIELKKGEFDLDNSIFTHNHPSGWTHPLNSPARYGTSFSVNDLCFAADYALAELRVITPCCRFLIKPSKKGWPKPHRIRIEHYEISKVVKFQTLKNIGMNIFSPSEATLKHTHSVMLELATKLNLIYKREFLLRYDAAKLEKLIHKEKAGRNFIVINDEIIELVHK